VSDRPDLAISRDPAGNLVVSPRQPWTAAGGGGGGEAPVFITGHLDHPAFVVERVLAPDGSTVEVSFRGGVMDVFFESAPIRLYPGQGESGVPATLTGTSSTTSPLGKHYIAELSGEADLKPGDIGTWLLLPPEIDERGLLHTPACDDLAGVAAALDALDELRRRRAAGEKTLDVRLLFTRAEEIGFIGAIAACKHKTMPKGSRVIALENSRSFADSPIGAGPIVRVGDRMSIFTPWLTNACAKRAEQLAGAPAQPLASQTAAATRSSHPWQRKLMPGGACEASVFCAYGYDATCLCLPLGNYHNMPHLAELQGGTYDREKLGPPRAAREFISIADYLGLVDLLVALGQELPRADPVLERVESLYLQRAAVLNS
jgi:endoglucanase